MPLPRRQKTPQQLKRIQNRTHNFKTGEVLQNRHGRNLKILPPMPDQAIRSEVSSSPVINTGSSTITTTAAVCEAALPTSSNIPNLPPLPDFLPKLEKMDELRSEQRRELMAAAVLSRDEFPLIMIDRGVLHSEIPREDKLDDLPFDPKSVRITTIQGGKLRSVAVVCHEPPRGPFGDKQYVSAPPKTAAGMTKGQIQRFLAKILGANPRNSKKKVTFANAEDIVKKASELKLNSHNTNETEMDTSDEAVPSGSPSRHITESDDDLLMSDSA
jgi:hypothetical protein